MLIVAFVQSVFIVSGQDQENLVNFIPKTPEASLLDTYGNIEANNSTGLPDITIPLHTIKVDGVSLPVTLNYVASGIKVNDIATPVGLKWLLNCGGMVSRNVIGKADETGYGWLNIDHNLLLEGTTTCDPTFNEFFYNGGYDFAPDRFSYSLLDESGNFVFDPLGNIVKTIQNGVRIETNINEESVLESFFKITDTKGNIYQFEVQERNTIYSIRTQGGFSREDDNMAPVGWKLSKIITPLGKEITFDYDLYEYSTGFYTTGYDYNVDPNNSGGPESIYGMFTNQTDQVTESKLISKITGDNEEVDFIYEFDSSLSVMKKKLTQIRISERVTGQPLKNIFLNYEVYSGDHRLMLKGVTICSGDETPIQSYEFNYKGESIPNLLPTLGSSCQDIFGYINSNTVEWMIPVLPTGSYPVSNREVDHSTITKGILEKITYPTGGSTMFTYEPNKYINNQNTAFYYPGVRVKSIKNLDINQALISEKLYEYTQAFSTNVHIENSYASYSHYYNDELRLHRFRKYSSNPISPFMSFPTSGFAYETVKAIQPNNGHVLTKYSFVEDCFSLKPLPIETRVVNESQELLKQVIKTYDINDFATVPQYELGDSYVFSGFITCGENTYCSALTGGQSIQCPNQLTLYSRLSDVVSVNSRVVELKSEETKEFLSNDNQVVSKSNYAYNSFHQISEQTQQQLTSSNQVVEETKQTILYPTDYSNQNIPELNSMVEKNMVGVPVEVTGYKRIGSDFMKMSGTANVFNSKGQAIQQNTWRSNTPDIGYWENVASYTYNPVTNRIIESVIMDNTSSYIWGYNQRLPIAKATNANHQDIAYTGFETSDDLGGWNYNSSSAYMDNSSSKTGGFSFKIYSGGNITKFLRENTKYELSYWIKDGALSIIGGIVTNISQSLPDANGWIHYKKMISIGATPDMLTIAWANGPNARVDDLRIHPINAQMETYNWLPGRGVSSVTDANGTTSYYEYDDLGRLLRIKDFEGNTLKEFEYKYVGSIEE